MGEKQPNGKNVTHHGRERRVALLEARPARPSSARALARLRREAPHRRGPPAKIGAFLTHIAGRSTPVGGY